MKKLSGFVALLCLVSSIAWTGESKTTSTGSTRNCGKNLIISLEDDSLLNWIKKNQFVIPADEALAVAQSHGLTIDELMVRLITAAKPGARPGISKFHVGAVGRTRAGELVAGVNLEFPGHALNQTVHAEQFVVALAHARHLALFESLASSSPPCGHCRQWLYELEDAKKLLIVTPGQKPMLLTDLLPQPFGPSDLGVPAALLAPYTPNGQAAAAMLAAKTPLQRNAIEAALDSYTPYSNSPAGVAIEIDDGRVFQGAVIENAAFNPSLSPMHTALVNLVASGVEYSQIKRVVLAEPESNTQAASYISTIQALLSTIAPGSKGDLVHF